MSVREREIGELPSPICPCLTERSGRDLLFSQILPPFLILIVIVSLKSDDEDDDDDDDDDEKQEA